MAVLPIILGVTGLGVVIALLAGGSKASPGGGLPVPSPSPTPGPRQRVIDGSTGTPGAFAAKYGGSFAKWTELPDVNPGVHRIYKHSDPSSTAGYVWVDTPTYEFPWGTSEVAIESSLSPWSIGQTVNLPASWPG